MLNLSRVMVSKLLDDDPEKLDVELSFCYMNNVAELYLMENYTAQDIGIFDMSNAKFAHLAKCPPSMLLKYHTVLQVRQITFIYLFAFLYLLFIIINYLIN